jgi:DNA polymerase III subunit gamma/tau
MLRDWGDAVEGVGKPQAEELKLEHEEAEAGGEKPWIDEAIQLFGEDLVVIKD